jgi:hypothetical protein
MTRILAYNNKQLELKVVNLFNMLMKEFGNTRKEYITMNESLRRVENTLMAMGEKLGMNISIQGYRPNIMNTQSNKYSISEEALRLANIKWSDEKPEVTPLVYMNDDGDCMGLCNNSDMLNIAMMLALDGCSIGKKGDE